jgi:fibro-slime domain-containing protein
MRTSKAVYRAFGLASAICAGVLYFACSASPQVGGGGAGGGGPQGGSNAGGGGQGGPAGGAGGAPATISLPPVPSYGGQGGTSTETTIPWPPPGFVNVTPASIGDYATSPDALSNASGSGGSGGSTGQAKCTNILFGIVRDFRMSTQEGTNPDFEQQPTVVRDDPGIVTDTLGSDGKPVYGDHPSGTATTHSADAFNQWYNDVDGVNMPYVVGLHFVLSGSVYTFAATVSNRGGTPNVSYFPLDGLGFNDTAQAADGKAHNFSFTTEIHTSFTYKGGETFTFQGDDDVWVYINDKLAIDMGGIHAQETKTVDLDAQASQLGIEKGNSYSLAVFNAERHVVQSNFRIDTTMTFDNCGIIPIQIF